MKHFLIIGGGVGGTSLAYHLLNRGAKVSLVDSGENYSSCIAAGQINPMVFRRMTKSWRIDELLPYAREFYSASQQFTEQKIIVEKSIRRMFAHDQEKDLWLERQEIKEFQDYLAKLTEEDLNFKWAKNECGSGRVLKSFYVMCLPYLGAMKNFISSHENGEWRSDNVDFSDLDPSATKWKENAYDGIIFCTGYLNMDNPYFDFLQVDQTKGEILTVSGEIYDDESLNRKCFLLPLGNKEFRVGSSYEWDTSDTSPTENAKIEILNNLNTLVDAKVEVVKHDAGIRPTTKDRRPIMGQHPDLKGFYIFNGLGAKGYVSAPLLGKEMAAHVLDGSPVHEEVDLRRYI